MKLEVLQEELAKALSLAIRFTSSRAQLPILSNILLSASKEKLNLSATNLEIAIYKSLGAKVEEEGDITVPARTINDIVGNLNSGVINLSSEEEHLKIASNNFKSTIPGINSSDFPKIPIKRSANVLNLPKEKISQCLAQVLFCASIDETRPVLTGVLLFLKKNKLYFVATDGFRLSQKSILLSSEAEDFTVILPKTILGEVMRISQDEETINFSFDKKENQAVFSLTNLILSSRVIDGEFPNFEKIIPKEAKVKVAVDKEELLQAVKLASIFARDSANIIKMNVKENFLETEAESQTAGVQKNKIEAKIEGGLSNDGFSISFNCRFLEEFLNVAVGESVSIELTDPSSPGVFKDLQDLDFLHLIMPIKT